jgi:hypothetical protein
MLAANRYWPWWRRCPPPFLCLLLLALGLALVSSIQLSIAPAAFLVAQCRVCLKLAFKRQEHSAIYTADLDSQFLGQFWPSVNLAHNVRVKSGACLNFFHVGGFGKISPRLLRTDDQHPTCTLQPPPWRVYSTYPHTQWVAST